MGEPKATDPQLHTQVVVQNVVLPTQHLGAPMPPVRPAREDADRLTCRDPDLDLAALDHGHALALAQFRAATKPEERAAWEAMLVASGFGWPRILTEPKVPLKPARFVIRSGRPPATADAEPTGDIVADGTIDGAGRLDLTCVRTHDLTAQPLYFRLYHPEGAVIVQGTVGTFDRAGDLILDNPRLMAGDSISGSFSTGIANS